MAMMNETNLSQMERLTTCPVCLDKFRTPKLLPCMHTFCLTPCLTNLVQSRARSLRCPECRREHLIPSGGVQAFPANLTMIGFLDLQSSDLNQTDRCFVCREQKQTLIKCHDCSKSICADCREGHFREASNQISSSVSQLRRTLPNLSEKIASYEQRVNSVKINHEQIQREITVAIAHLMEELKHRETALFTEAEVYLQSQLRTFRLQQETVEVELASAASFCESFESSSSNTSTINDVDLANMRAQCNRYLQQMETLQSQMPTDVQKLRFLSDNQPALSNSIQDFGRLIDVSKEQQPSRPNPTSTPARLPLAEHPHSAMIPTAYQDHYRQLEDLYYSRSSTAVRPPPPPPFETSTYRRTYNHFSGSVDNPFVDLNLMTSTPYRASWQAATPQRSSSIFGPNPFAGNTATRSSSGESRPTRERERPAAPVHEEQEEEESSPPNRLQRSNTFVLEEPSLPNLPQSGAQRPRDNVNVQELYNVRPRDRAQAPVTFTINLNGADPNNTNSQ